VDTSFYSPNATLNLMMSPDPPQTVVTWAGLSGVAYSGATLTKTATTSAWDAGAYSTQSIPGAAGGGFVEMVATESSTWRMFGLSHGNTNSDYTDIDYALFVTGDGNSYSIQVYEKGVQKGNFGTYNIGDVFRVEVGADNKVRYLKNNIVFYTSTAAPTFPLLVDTAFNTPHATLTDVRIATSPL
jgi:hypothetical protein